MLKVFNKIMVEFIIMQMYLYICMYWQKCIEFLPLQILTRPNQARENFPYTIKTSQVRYWGKPKPYFTVRERETISRENMFARAVWFLNILV